MTNAPPDAPGIAPVYRDDPRLQPLIGPGRAVRGRGGGGRRRRRCAISSARRARSWTCSTWATAHEALVNVVFDDERLTFARRAAPGPQPGARAARRPSACAPATGSRSRCATCPSTSSSFWGAALNGAIVVPLNSWWAGGELDLRAARRRRGACCSPTTSASNGSLADGPPRGSSTSVGRAHRPRRRRVRRPRPGAPIDDGADRAPRPRRPDRRSCTRRAPPAGPRARSSPTGR